MALPLERIRALLLSAVLLVIPLVFWPWARESYHLVKEGGLLVFGVPAFVAWWLAGKPGLKSVPHWYLWAAGLFILWAVVRALGTADGASAAVAAGEWALVLLVAASGLGLGARSRRRATGFLVAGTAAVSLFGILQHILGWQLLVPYKVDPRSVTFTSERVFSTFGNPIFFAGHLLLVIPLTVTMLAEAARKSAWRAAPWLAALALEVAALSLAASRSAFLGLAAGAILLGLMVREMRRWVAVLGGAVALAALLAVAVRPALIQHVLTAGDPGRLLMWKTAGRMLADFPLLGAGTGQFASRYPCVQLRVASPGDVGFGVNAVHAHNDFLEAAAEWGAPGALLFAAAMLGLLFLPGGSAAAWGVRAGTLGIAVHALFNFPLRVSPTSSFAFLLPALLLLPEGEGSGWSPRLRHLALLAVVAVMAFSLRPFLRSCYFQWALAYQDGKQYQRSAELFVGSLKLMPDDAASRVTFCMGKMRYEGGDLLGAQEAFQADLDRFPCYPESWGNLGVIYGVRAMNGEAGALRKAEELVLKALSLRPGSRESAGDYNSLGNIRILAGNERGALEAYRQALKWEEGSAEAVGNVVRLLVRLGRRGEAREITSKALARDPENPELKGIAAALEKRK